MIDSKIHWLINDFKWHIRFLYWWIDELMKHGIFIDQLINLLTWKNGIAVLGNLELRVHPTIILSSNFISEIGTFFELPSFHRVCLAELCKKQLAFAASSCPWLSQLMIIVLQSQTQHLLRTPWHPHKLMLRTLVLYVNVCQLSAFHKQSSKLKLK